MREAPAPTKTQGASENHEPQQDSIGPASFAGTENPRHLRALFALLQRPRPREELDRIAGCSNGPQLVAELRSRGLGEIHLPCERIRFVDRDGKVCRPGVYTLTDKGRRMIRAWLARREGASRG